MHVIITQDVRVLGKGFAPGGDPVDVDDAIGEVLLKEGFAVTPDAALSGGGNKQGGNDAGDDSKGQSADIAPVAQKALFAAPENK